MDQFSNPLEDPHPIRLLTVARVLTTPAADSMTSSVTGSGGGESSGNGATLPSMVEAHTLCLTVELAARDRALIVSTVERTYDFLSAATQYPGNDMPGLVKDLGYSVIGFYLDLLRVNKL